jgi:hypothetical protein
MSATAENLSSVNPASQTAAGAVWALAQAGRGKEVGWIQSPLFDLSLFTLSPLAGLLVVLPALAFPKGIYVLIVATYLVAIPHYVSSFSFYMGDDNLAYYRTRRLAFFAGPALIFLAVTGLRLTKIDAAVQCALYVWNVYHVSMQSAGILSIYRRINGGSFSESLVARASLLGVNGSLAFLHIDRFRPIYDNLVRVHFPVWAIRPAFFTFATVAVLLYLRSLSRRQRALRVPELAFIISSFLLFHPYLWVQDLNIATFGMLMGHFLQYLGIVWLLNRRKYSVAEGSGHQKLLSAISTSTPRLVLTLVSVGFLFLLADKGSSWLGVPISYVILWNSLALIHFYLDGLVWAFRDPFVRKSIGPYLIPESQTIAG